jgi:hypothetical protein
MSLSNSSKAAAGSSSPPPHRALCACLNLVVNSSCPIVFKLPLKYLYDLTKEDLTEAEIKAANQKNIADLAKRVRDLYEEGKKVDKEVFKEDIFLWG